MHGTRKPVVKGDNKKKKTKRVRATGNSKKTRYIKRGTFARHYGGKNDVFGKK